jgi:hypothetical protein
MRGCEVLFCSIDLDDTGIRVNQPCQNLDQSGLSSAIGTYQTMHFTRGNFDVDALKRPGTAI